MKIKSLLPLLFIAISTFCFAQDYKKQIETDFTDYMNLLIAGEYAKSANYIYEEIFTIVPKEDLIKYMEQSFNSPEVDIELRDPKILTVEASEKIDNKHYSLLTYSLVMMIRYVGEDENEADKTSKNDLMKAALSASFGEDNVTYNAETEYFRIYSKKLVCAVSGNGVDQWKFITLEKEQTAMYENILPKQISERIKEYKY